MSSEGQEHKRFTDTRQIEQLVESFESCTVPPAGFDHGAHLAVALWYLSESPADEATRRMRVALQRFTECHNAQAKYNETMTLFWLKLVRRFLERADAARPLAERANELLASYRDSQLAFEYYSRALLDSPEAKQAWVEPDLKPLVF